MPVGMVVASLAAFTWNGRMARDPLNRDGRKNRVNEIVN